LLESREEVVIESVFKLADHYSGWFYSFRDMIKRWGSILSPFQSELLLDAKIFILFGVALLWWFTKEDAVRCKHADLLISHTPAEEHWITVVDTIKNGASLGALDSVAKAWCEAYKSQNYIRQDADIPSAGQLIMSYHVYYIKLKNSGL